MTQKPRITISLAPATLEKLNQLAEEKGFTKSGLITDLVNRANA